LGVRVRCKVSEDDEFSTWWREWFKKRGAKLCIDKVRTLGAKEI